MNEIKRRREIYELGQRAIEYYLDTGFCVFCEADDAEFVPHEDHCNVGVLSGVEQTKERAKEKHKQRAIVDSFIIGRLEK